MELKKVCLKALCVFLAVFVLPLGIFVYAKNVSNLSPIAAATAGLTFGRKIDMSPNSAGTQISADLLGGREISLMSVWDINMAPEETEIPSESGEVPTPLPSDEILQAIPYPTTLNDLGGVIEQFHYGHYSGGQYFDLDGGGQVRNCTEIANSDLYAYSQRGSGIMLEKNSDQPQILIYHTHATESFEPYSREFYDSEFTCKTTDRSMNIVSVGDKICEQLDKAGICYLHDTLVHDYPSYNGSYQSSRETVRELLEQYPSIKICIDLHRDGIEREDGTRLAPVTEIDGENAAQIMIISCCDDGSGNIPNCMENFTFACELQSALESDWQGITRPILFDTRFYNQDLSAGSLLIEVGSHGNSIDEVQQTGELIGKTIAEHFSEN